jgi:hypothetical protein
MPNWCENTLMVKSDNVMTDILTHYICRDEKSKGNFFDFEKIIPIHTLDNDELRHKECTEKWGTKWRPYNIVCRCDHMVFTTAWTPPIPIIRKLATLYPSVQFILEYSEPEMGIQGIYSAQMEKGQIIENKASWEEFIDKYSPLRI